MTGWHERTPPDGPVHPWTMGTAPTVTPVIRLVPWSYYLSQNNSPDPTQWSPNGTSMLATRVNVASLLQRGLTNHDPDLINLVIR